MRNQECKNKDTQTSRNPQQENDQCTERNEEHQRQLKENGKTKRCVIKGFSQMEQTIEKWESWQQEINNKVDYLKEGARKKNIRTLLYSGLLKVIMTAFTV